MTEAEWNSCTEPQKMLAALRASGRATERKLRLFAVWSCRRVWTTLYEVEQRTVQIAEQLLEGTVGEEERTATFEDVRRGYMAAYGRDAVPVAFDLLDRDAWSGAEAVLLLLPGPPDEALREKRAWCDLLRCIIGPALFRPPPPLAPAALAWDGGTVARLAAGVDEERDFTPGRMGVLADAAEEAGVNDADVLAHLRGPGRHVRGCWAVDLLLGKQ